MFLLTKAALATIVGIMMFMMQRNARSPGGPSRFNLTSCNCVPVNECVQTPSQQLQGVATGRICGFQGFRRKICCGDQPITVQLPPSATSNDITPTRANEILNLNDLLGVTVTTTTSSTEKPTESSIFNIVTLPPNQASTTTAVKFNEQRFNESNIAPTEVGIVPPESETAQKARKLKENISSTNYSDAINASNNESTTLTDIQNEGETTTTTLPFAAVTPSSIIINNDENLIENTHVLTSIVENVTMNELATTTLRTGSENKVPVSNEDYERATTTTSASFVDDIDTSLIDITTNYDLLTKNETVITTTEANKVVVTTNRDIFDTSKMINESSVNFDVRNKTEIDLDSTEMSEVTINENSTANLQEITTISVTTENINEEVEKTTITLQDDRSKNIEETMMKPNSSIDEQTTTEVNYTEEYSTITIREMSDNDFMRGNVSSKLINTTALFSDSANQENVTSTSEPNDMFDMSTDDATPTESIETIENTTVFASNEEFGNDSKNETTTDTTTDIGIGEQIETIVPTNDSHVFEYESTTDNSNFVNSVSINTFTEVDSMLELEVTTSSPIMNEYDDQEMTTTSENINISNPNEKFNNRSTQTSNKTDAPIIIPVSPTEVDAATTEIILEEHTADIAIENDISEIETTTVFDDVDYNDKLQSKNLSLIKKDKIAETTTTSNFNYEMETTTIPSLDSEFHKNSSHQAKTNNDSLETPQDGANKSKGSRKLDFSSSTTTPFEPNTTINIVDDYEGNSNSTESDDAMLHTSPTPIDNIEMTTISSNFEDSAVDSHKSHYHVSNQTDNSTSIIVTEIIPVLNISEISRKTNHSRVNNTTGELNLEKLYQELFSAVGNSSENELVVNIDVKDDRTGFDRSDPYIAEKEIENSVSNVVEQLLLTSHKNFRLLPTFVECASARLQRHGTRLLHSPVSVYMDNQPWMARIGYKDSGAIVFSCAGTVISRRYILTSAYCAQKYPQNSIVQVLLEGAKFHFQTSVHKGNETHSIPKIKYGVESVITHTLYNNDTTENDIALIRVDDDILFNSTSSIIRPLCLPFEDGYGVWESLPKPGESAYLSGWRFDPPSVYNESNDVQFEDSPKPDTETVTIWSTDQCRAAYNKTDERIKISEKQICAYGENKGSCRTDYGGPLVAIMTRHKLYFQIGVVSHGPKCGYGIPSVYTSVNEYLKWILDSIH